MRIIILTAIPFWHPGTQELIDHLREKDVQITALDIFHGYAINDQNETIDLVPLKLKGSVRKVYMKLFRKSFTRKHTENADILDIHFVEPAYVQYIPDLGKKFICTLFGSDLFRTSAVSKQEQRALFDNCDRILLSRNMLPYFETHFGLKSEKYLFNQYGSARIDSVYEALTTLDKTETQNKWGVPEGKTVVTIGYNGKPEQQHLKVIERLNDFSQAEKKQLFFVFPMTYGGDTTYHTQVAERASLNGLTTLFLHDRLTDQEITELRIISDITINAQTTDALASSIKEAMVSGDVVLVGDWLPYEIYAELGVHYLTFDLEGMSKELRYALGAVEKLQKKGADNANIIRKFASWNALVDQWISDYQRLYNESK